jgi:hypothetical protein
MQAHLTVKQFAITHFGVTALAFGILVSSLTAAATLGLTGEFPGFGDGASAPLANSASTTMVTDAERRQLMMERADYIAWRNEDKLAAGSVATTNVQTTDAERRQLDMEREEFNQWRRLQAPEIDKGGVTNQ